MTDLRIVRRAYSQYTEIAIVNATHIEALEIAMKMQRTNQDGEYLVRAIGEAYQYGGNNQCPVQAAFAYL